MYGNDSSKQWNERLREAMLARDKSQTDISRATGSRRRGSKNGWMELYQNQNLMTFSTFVHTLR